jgi:hypothetical protein
MTRLNVLYFLDVSVTVLYFYIFSECHVFYTDLPNSLLTRDLWNEPIHPLEN